MTDNMTYKQLAEHYMTLAEQDLLMAIDPERAHRANTYAQLAHTAALLATMDPAPLLQGAPADL